LIGNKERADAENLKPRIGRLKYSSLGLRVQLTI